MGDPHTMVGLGDLLTLRYGGVEKGAEEVGRRRGVVGERCGGVRTRRGALRHGERCEWGEDEVREGWGKGGDKLVGVCGKVWEQVRGGDEMSWRGWGGEGRLYGVWGSCKKDMGEG